MDRSLKRGSSPRLRKGLFPKLSSLTVGLLTLLCGAQLFNWACTEGIRRHGMPSSAQAVIDTAIEDIDAGRYDKLYNEAADEWRREATLTQSMATLKMLRDKLGSVRTRDLQS